MLKKYIKEHGDPPEIQKKKRKKALLSLIWSPSTHCLFAQAEEGDNSDDDGEVRNLRNPYTYHLRWLYRENLVSLSRHCRVGTVSLHHSLQGGATVGYDAKPPNKLIKIMGARKVPFDGARIAINVNSRHSMYCSAGTGFAGGAVALQMVPQTLCLLACKNI